MSRSCTFSKQAPYPGVHTQSIFEMNFSSVSSEPSAKAGYSNNYFGPTSRYDSVNPTCVSSSLSMTAAFLF
jgi:hypothetical protein